MRNNLSIKQKLIVLALLPCLACSVVFYHYSKNLYQELQDTRSIDERFVLFYQLEVLLSLGRQLQSSYVNKSSTTPDFTPFSSQLTLVKSFDIRSLKNTISHWPQLTYANLIDEATGLQDLKVAKDLEANESIAIISDFNQSVINFIDRLPVDVDSSTLRHHIQAYLLMVKMKQMAFDEVLLYQDSFQHQTDISRYQLQQLITGQQFLLDQFLNKYATENEGNYLLNTFKNRAFTSANDSRNDLLTFFNKPAYLVLSQQKLDDISC